MGSERGLRRDRRGESFAEVGTEFLTRLAEPSHIVQFYESDDFLCGLVADYLAAGIEADEPLVVFATAEHSEVFRSALGARGIDVDRACASGRLSLIDARETLARFMVDGMPDWERFQRVVGDAIDRGQLHARRARVRAYVELIDLLWRDGNDQAAVRLEEMWNDLGKSRRPSLLCAYVIGSFYKEGHADGHPATLHQICRTHTHLLPPEPPAPASIAARRAQVGMSARRARRLAAEIEHRKAIEKALRASLAELRCAEEALRESQEELQDFVDNAAEGMEWLGPGGTILWANRAQLDLLGYGRDEYIGHHVSEFRADPVEDFTDRLERDETVRDYEARVRCKDGSIKHVLLDANVFRKGGEFVHTRCFTRDITARKRAHDAIMRLHTITASLSEARTQAEVLDVVTRHTIAATGALGASVHLIGADGDSLQLARAVGYADRVIDRAATISLDANLPIADAARRAVPVFLQSGEASSRYPGFEDTADASGSRSLARLPLIVDGRPIGVLGVSHGESTPFGENEQAFLTALAHQCAQALERARLYDAESSARRQAEASQHRSAFLSKASAILSSSLDYEATLTNLARLAVPRIADWCMVELAGGAETGSSQLVVADGDPAQVERLRDYRRRVPPDPTAPVGVARVIGTGRSELHREISDAFVASFAPDGEYQGFLRRLGLRSAIVVPMTARGRTLGAIALVSAASERRFEQADLDMAEELGHRAAMAIDNARLYQEAREADRRKDEFLAMLGHELRNPLAPILTGLKLMQLRGIGGERERQVIERQVQYLVRLVDDLLDVSRITRGRVKLHSEPVELSHVLAKAIEMASPLFEQRSHQLAVDVARSGLLVEVDQIRLAQVLANLLTNAAKYTDPHGTIVVSGRRERGEVVIAVRDSGMGISADVLPRVFDLFVQGDRALDRSQGGLGIGLTLARNLVEAHGGTIAAHSDGLGMGSEFTVRLPACSGRAATEREFDSVPPRADGRRAGIRILLVDDNTDAADVLAEVLRRAGHEVAVAYDGPQALGIARAFQPNAALLDIGLPVLDGYELAERLRELLPGYPLRLVAVTGYGQDTDKHKSRAAGFDAHLVKPIDLRALLALLAEESPSEDSREQDAHSGMSARPGRDGARAHGH
jgi:PAS domain S-box-containing protein